MHPSPLSIQKRQLALDEIRDLGYFQSVHWVDSIDSTNKSLMADCRETQTNLPALLIADKQTMGVGRGDHRWWSPTGCLMFSMAIPISNHGGNVERPVASASTDSTLLPLRVGCTVARCIEPFSTSKPMVKWPNDVYLVGKKVCGILIDTIPSVNGLPSVAVIGIGINCQVDLEQAPLEIRSSATSLHLCARRNESEGTSTENILVQFVHTWLELEKKQVSDPEWLKECWSEWSLLDEQWVEVKHASGTSAGKCVGISDSGALRLMNEQLEITEILAGSVVSFRSIG